MADHRPDQRGRMLTVAVDEQDGVEPGVVEAGEQSRLLAEIARQRDDLHVERRRRRAMGDRESVVAAAGVDVDHLALSERVARSSCATSASRTCRRASDACSL